MPFSGSAYAFGRAVVSAVNEVGAVYGLFYSTTRGYVCLYVGQTDNLRRRLTEHLNNPPVAGVTHFFAEAYSSARDRAIRENSLIAEFQPRGNTIGRRWRDSVELAADPAEVEATLSDAQDREPYARVEVDRFVWCRVNELKHTQFGWCSGLFEAPANSISNGTLEVEPSPCR
jgi:hypothetical protein